MFKLDWNQTIPIYTKDVVNCAKEVQCVPKKPLPYTNLNANSIPKWANSVLFWPSVHHVFIFLHLEFSIDLHSELEVDERDQFALWISFAEIYNEQIYDLLEPVNMKEKKRTVLKLGEDKNGQPYIKGMFWEKFTLKSIEIKPLTPRAHVEI